MRARLAVCLLSAFALLPGAAQAGTALSGQVLDSTGRPVSGAGVWVLHEGDWNGSPAPDTVTAGDGTFTVSGLPPHTGVVLAACTADASMDPIELQELPWDSVDLALQPAARIIGRVVSAEGAPVAGASVSLLREPRSRETLLSVPFPCSPQDSGQTGTDGRFTLAGLKSGVYALQVRAPGFADQEIRGVRLHAGEIAEGLDVPLDPRPGEPTEPEAAIAAIEPATNGSRRRAVPEDDPDEAPGTETRGQVTDPNGEPVPRAKVRAVRADGIRHEALSRRDGSFLLRLEDGTWSVAAQADGYLPASSAAAIEVAGAAAPIDLRLERALVLRGQLFGLTREEVPTVRAKRGSVLLEGAADPDGGYVVTGLTPGTWIVDAELHAEGTWNGSRSAVGNITLRPGETDATLDLDFDLGRLSLALHAPDGEKILLAQLVRPDGSILATSGLTESPSIVFDRLPQGTYHLVWSLGDRGEIRGEQDVTLTTDRELTLVPEIP